MDELEQLYDSGGCLMCGGALEDANDPDFCAPVCRTAWDNQMEFRPGTRTRRPDDPESPEEWWAMYHRLLPKLSPSQASMIYDLVLKNQQGHDELHETYRQARERGDHATADMLLRTWPYKRSMPYDY